MGALALKHMKNANEINREIIEEWVAGNGKQPVTWKTLAQVLCDIKLPALAEEIEAIKSKLKEVEIVFVFGTTTEEFGS